MTCEVHLSTFFFSGKVVCCVEAVHDGFVLSGNAGNDERVCASASRAQNVSSAICLRAESHDPSASVPLCLIALYLAKLHV